MRDVRLKAVLDDQASPALGRLQGNLKGFEKSGATTFSAVVGKAENQAASILQKTGGIGLLPASMVGAGGAGLVVSKAATGHIKALEKELVAAEQKSKSFVASLAQTNVGFKAVAVSLGIVIAKLTIFTKFMQGMAKNADYIDTMAQRMGMAVDEFQALDYAAKRSSTSVESIANAFRLLQQKALDALTGSDEAVRVFNALNVSLFDSDGNIKTASELFDDVIDSLRGVESEVVRNALAQKVLGRSYQDLIPLINTSKNSLKDLKDEARRDGFIISDQDIANLDAVHESFVRMGVAWKKFLSDFASETTTQMNRWQEGWIDMLNGAGKGWGKFVSFVWKSWETLVRSTYLLGQGLGKALESTGKSAGYGFMIGLVKSMEGWSMILRTTIGRLLPEALQESWEQAEKDMNKFSKGMFSEVKDSWGDLTKFIKVEADKIEQIWEKIDLPVPKKLEKNKYDLEELQVLLKSLSRPVRIRVDTSDLERQIRYIDMQIAAYERLADVYARFAGLRSSFDEISIRNMQEQSRMLHQLETDYRQGLISYQEMAQAKSMIDQVFVSENRRNMLNAYNQMNDYSIRVLSSFAGFAEQLSENEIRRINDWEQREARRIDNSILAAEYKDAEMAKLAAQAEARRKEEWNRMKALRISEAIINTAAGFTRELATGGVYGIITGLLVAAAGAAEIATIAAQQYAQGGIVPGNQRTGDKVPARVNSGEMILTPEQQARLFEMANGGGGVGHGDVTISAPITINGNADTGTVQALAGAHEKQLESIRSAISELQYRGRIAGVTVR